MANIKPGYQLHITTWENDGDNYNTIITSGLSKEDVVFLVDLANCFGRNSNIGNEWVRDEDLREVLEKVLTKHPSISSDMSEEWREAMEDFEEDSYYARDLLREHVLSTPGEGYGGDFCRIVENIKVYYFPNEVVDITHEFV